MQWSDENNFDWRAGLQNLEAEPADADTLWQRIESRLDNRQPKRWVGMTVLRQYASLAAAVALVIWATASLWLPNQPVVTQPIASVTESGDFQQKTLPETTDVPTHDLPVEKIEKKSVVVPTLAFASASNLVKAQQNQNLLGSNSPSRSDSVPEIHPSKLYQAGLVALGKGQYCTSHYNMTLAKMSLCQKDHLHQEVDQMIRFVEDKIATNCFCMADPNEPGNCQ